MSRPTRKAISTPTTVGDHVDVGTSRLAAAGVPNPRREARLLLAHVLELDPVAIIGYPERLVADGAAYERLIERRADREPLSYLTGRREFWSLDLEVTSATLDPRPDSETVVGTALAAFPDPGARIDVLDFGTGTGCLLLAILHERPEARGLGVDIDGAAIAVASRNADRLGLAGRARFMVGAWGAAVTGRFDLIVSNPPYIASVEIDGLQREVAHFEPRRALDGGADGLAAYRALAADVARLLSPAGVAVIEFGAGQGAAVAQIIERVGLVPAGFTADLAGHDRCLSCHKR